VQPIIKTQELLDDHSSITSLTLTRTLTHDVSILTNSAVRGKGMGTGMGMG